MESTQTIVKPVFQPLAGVATVLFLFSVLLVVTTPCVAAQQRANTGSKIEKNCLTHFEGQTLSANGTPLADVQIEFACHVYRKHDQVQKRLRWETSSGSDGKFRVDIGSASISAKTAFFLAIEYSKDEYISGKSTRWTDGSKSFDGKLKDLVVKRAVKAIGELVPPVGAESTPIENARITVGQKVGGVWEFVELVEDSIHSKQDGSFEFLIAEDSKLLVMVQADNFAMTKQEVYIPALASEEQVQDIGEIRLTSGTRITGYVIDKDDVPRGNIVVSLSQESRVNDSLETIQTYVKTDVEGYFELPPRLGECLVSVAKQGVVDGKAAKSEGKLFPTKPLRFDFDGQQESIEIELVESPVCKISGSTFWNEGDENKAAPKIMYRLDDVHQRNQEVELDANGHFEFEVLEGMPGRIWVVGGNSPHDLGENGYIEGRLTTATLKKNREVWGADAHRTGNKFEFSGFHRDESGIEFELFFNPPSNRKKLGPMLLNEVLPWLMFGEFNK